MKKTLSNRPIVALDVLSDLIASTQYSLHISEGNLVICISAFHFNSQLSGYFDRFPSPRVVATLWMTCFGRNFTFESDFNSDRFIIRMRVLDFFNSLFLFSKLKISSAYVKSIQRTSWSSQQEEGFFRNPIN